MHYQARALAFQILFTHCSSVIILRARAFRIFKKKKNSPLITYLELIDVLNASRRFLLIYFSASFALASSEYELISPQNGQYIFTCAYCLLSTARNLINNNMNQQFTSLVNHIVCFIPLSIQSARIGRHCSTYYCFAKSLSLSAHFARNKNTKHSEFARKKRIFEINWKGILKTWVDGYRQCHSKQ